jgi:hypothetical protein
VKWVQRFIAGKRVFGTLVEEAAHVLLDTDIVIERKIMVLTISKAAYSAQQGHIPLASIDYPPALHVRPAHRDSFDPGVEGHLRVTLSANLVRREPLNLILAMQHVLHAEQGPFQH